MWQSRTQTQTDCHLSHSTAVLSVYWLSYRWETKSWSLRDNLNFYIRGRELELKSTLLGYILTEGCCQFDTTLDLSQKAEK